MLTRLGADNIYGRVPATYGGAAPRGNGYLVPVIPKTDFSFDGRTNTIAPFPIQDVPVGTGFDSSSWVSGVLSVRLHAKNTWSSSATLNIYVDNIMLVPEEPDVVFAASYSNTTTGALVGTPVATASFTNADTAPALKIITLAGIGPMLRVRVNWVQGTTAAAAQQTVSLGIDLVGRPA